jgi:phosphate starvation-inducible PhoH-like protein
MAKQRDQYARAKSDSKAKRKQHEKKQYANNVFQLCKPVEGLTQGQCELIKAIKRSTVVMITGPAGCGKTFIPTALAADALQHEEVDRVVCTRPMISCGNDLGILPGDVDEKFGPYMLPIMDVFNQRLGKSTVEAFVKSKRIQQIPMQLLRGASIDNAVILLDECQNSSVEQLEMLLTRIGEGTKLIINGDLRQKDIPNSGLMHVLNKLSHVDGIEHVELDVDDIVRSGIVKDIVVALWES